MSFSSSRSGFNISAISDKWYEACHAKSSGFFIGMTETYRRTLHYDAIVTIMAIILIILPILFKIYGFGVQTQLLKFYNKLVYNFCFYQLLLGMGFEFCAILHIFINQQPACLKWDVNRTFFNRGVTRNPNPDLVLQTILVSALISYTKKYRIARYLIAFILLLFGVLSQIFGGVTSVMGAISSVSLGVWLICLAKFVTPIVFSIFNGILILLDVIAVIVSSALFGFRFYNTKDSNYLAIRGLATVAMSAVFYIHYGLSRENFEWFSSDWTESIHEKDSDSGAEIPKMDTGAKTVDFGSVLNGDLICSIVGFSIFLLVVTAISFERNSQSYSFFN